MHCQLLYYAVHMHAHAKVCHRGDSCGLCIIRVEAMRSNALECKVHMQVVNDSVDVVAQRCSLLHEVSFCLAASVMLHTQKRLIGLPTVLVKILAQQHVQHSS